MTKSQKLTLEQSEKRQRINELLALEELTDEQRNELDTLTKRMQALEVELRAAIVAEGAAEAEARAAFGGGDGEAGERGRLMRETTLADYLGPAAAGGALQGRAAELNAALDTPLTGPGGGVGIPWAMLETRAFTTTGANDGGEMQRPILQRLFGPGIMDALGVRMDSVPAGRVEWPLVTGAAAPAQTAEGTAAAAAVAATFSYANLKPKKLTGALEYTHEAAASVPGLEQALRRDLGDAVRSKMSDLIVNGAAPTDANPHNIEGFVSELDQADDQAAADAARYGRLHAEGVDAIHAGMETEVMSVIGEETYRHAAGVYIAGSGESGSELLRRRSGGCIASSYIPDASGNIQPAILHAAGPNGGGAAMRGDSVAAVWPVLEVVRDIYTQASQGVRLTWVALWDAKVAFRPAAYKLVGVKLA